MSAKRAGGTRDLRSMGTVLAGGIILTFLTLTNLYGQATGTGMVVGTVTDPAGAVVPEAQVTIHSDATGISRSIPTNSAGRYEFPDLGVGTYTVTVTKAGFNTARVPNVMLEVGAQYAVDVTLVVGNTVQTVDVAAIAPLLQTETNQVSQVVDNRTVVEMPLNGRNFQQLQELVPGVINAFNFQSTEGLGGGASIGGPSTWSEVVSGERSNSSSYLLDGGNTSDQAFRSTNFIPAIDAIQEFKQITSNAQAEYGYGPTTVTVAIKSGTNQLHGSGWDFLRNKVLDARNYFSPVQDNLTRNQFGFALGGPIKRNRIFWFVSYEGLRQSDTNPTFATVPLVAERTGDFSADLGGQVGTDALGRTVLANQVFDPLTSRNVTAGQVDPTTGLTAIQTGIVREPFANNMIPSGRINPASAFMMSQFIPAPNAAGTFNNYTAAGLSTDGPNTTLFKIDAQLTDKDHLFFTGGRFSDIPATPGPYSPSNQGLTQREIPGQTGVLGWTHTISPTTLLDMHASMSSAEGIFTGPTVQGPDAKSYFSELGISPTDGGIPFYAATPGIPSVAINGFTGTSGLSHFPTGWRMNTTFASANLTKLRGKHSLQFGYALNYWKGGFFAQGDHRGNWNWNGAYTTPYATTGSGVAVTPTSINALGDYLLGYPYNSVRTAPWGWLYMAFKDHWFYAQDSYKVTPKLTLNYGLRYEIDPFPHGREGQQSAWLPTLNNGQGGIVVGTLADVSPPLAYLHPTTIAYTQLFQSQGLLFTAAQAGLPTALRYTPYDDFAPRVGLAWNPLPNTVVRAGFGMYFLPTDLNREGEGLSNPPFVDRSNTLLNTYPIPAYNIQNSYCRAADAAFPGQCVPGNPFAFPTISSLVTEEPRAKTPTTEQWNVSLQHTFRNNWLADLSYVGNNAHHLQGYWPINNSPPEAGNVQSNRPFPIFGPVNYQTDRFNSSYSSLQFYVQHQFSHGFLLTAAYTWEHWIDDLTEDSSSPLNPFDMRSFRGTGDLDIPQHLAISYVYEIPAGQHSGAIGQVIDHWEVTGITSAQSGFPFTPQLTGDLTNTGIGYDFPDRVCNGKLSNPTPQAWFNVSCFVTPSAVPGTNGAVFNYGDSGRNILRMDRIFSFDFGVFKNFKLTEQFKLQFRAEAFNLFNNVSFGPPALTVNVPGAGVVSSAGPPRILQFGAKVSF